MDTMKTDWTMRLPKTINGADTMAVLKNLEQQLPYKFACDEFGDYMVTIDSKKKRTADFKISDFEMVSFYAPKFIDIAAKLNLMPEKVFPMFRAYIQAYKKISKNKPDDYNEYLETLRKEKR